MNPDFEVDATDLRDTAAAVTGLAARVSDLAAAVPPIDPSPPWAVTRAATVASGSAVRWVAVLGADLAGTAGRLRAAADTYEQADSRAAARLRAAR
ncbi:hypothetical protein [Actinoplanes utahensis]|uniref:ESX-1 secretion-associated protein n=1 Tax=Actinoplanes utahensis TaxID=1869 RepID=A0A0A6UHD4_ACTUT|nr:hypothetical protein [Actinoplanes utahensis]KHD73729.1 hypothetical protein MB27_32230 [Actinoplanes utahensis]GIF27917.1 hypothetical protein Aut01nite_09030 [Actinoplanes utahensis]